MKLELKLGVANAAIIAGIAFLTGCMLEGGIANMDQIKYSALIGLLTFLTQLKGIIESYIPPKKRKLIRDKKKLGMII